MKAYEYQHVVGFQETNLTGNVYFVSHLSWQGRCRELFLMEHCPDVLERIGKDFCLITGRCACEYFAELNAFDRVSIRMTLKAMAQNRMTLAFEYYRLEAGGEELVARGEQEVIVMRREGDQLVAAAIPDSLREAVKPYSA